MRRALRRAGSVLFFSAAILSAQPEPPLFRAELFEPPADPRFFGTYCQVESFKVCDDAFFGLFEGCKTVRNGVLHMRHTSQPRGGLVSGNGRFVAGGNLRGASIAGEVRGRGAVRAYASVPAAGEGFGWAYLSEDGLTLRVEALGETFVLRKDFCGNGAPAPTLTSLQGATLDFGRQAGFRAEIADEDNEFPLERLTFESDRDGALSGSILFPPSFPDFAATLFTDRLSAGDHTITLTAVDKGGLPGSASVDVTVVNQAPDSVQIVRPTAATDLVLGGRFFLEGKAFDPEDFLLPGEQLSWATKLGAGNFIEQGTGRRREMSFALPADPAENVDTPAVIRLTAADSSGNEATAELPVTVRSHTGNTPPRVAILFPDDLVVGAFELLTAGGYNFQATALDIEDPPADLQLEWSCQVISGDPDSCPPFDPPDATTTLAGFSPDEITHYEIGFSATDSGGLTDIRTLSIAVLATGQIP